LEEESKRGRKIKEKEEKWKLGVEIERNGKQSKRV